MLQWIGRFLRKRHRNIDRRFLFTRLFAESHGDTEAYRHAVLQHIERDPSWQHADEWMFRIYKDPWENILMEKSMWLMSFCP